MKTTKTIKETLEFGVKCRDIVTGFEGVVETRGVFITGCDRVKLTHGIKDEEKHWFDVPTLEIIDREMCEKLKTIECNRYSDIDEAIHSFGAHVKDKITGYEGVVVAKSISINGDICYCVSPTYDRTSKDNSGSWYDESRLVLIEDKKEEIVNASRRVGGAVPDLKLR